jgi:hypothetical protein
MGPSRATLLVDGTGDGQELLASLAERHLNIVVRGPYVESPENLQEIYSRIDLQIILDPPGNENVRVTLPNRLFHCLALSTPAIVSVGSASAQLVERLGVGCAVDPETVNWDSFLDSVITERQIDHWRAALDELPADSRVRSDDALKQFVAEIASGV